MIRSIISKSLKSGHFIYSPRYYSSTISSTLSSTTTSSSSTTTAAAASPLPTTTTPDIIGVEDFFKVDLRIARVINAEHVKGAKKLIKLTLDLGEKKQKPTLVIDQPTTTTTTINEPIIENQEPISPPPPPPSPAPATRDIRTVFSGVKAYYEPEQLLNKNVIVVANLAPKKTKFGVSEAMVLFASDDDSKNVIYSTLDPTVASDAIQPGWRVL
ncbi:methionyl-trna synthetase beta subunit [Cavenderia fasciculata]|uniref:Methionyl-trna synthetase beta subunit n=1 Tax=Cavenderia fasciculata TaxID=261658 RepID=F4PVA7_CACFS|nr:methionyl-trna synthetase beta subunit [Cavenderia fasciculata]EGG19921.1 methionyl-trna synthetase beta subunit [Cavenderia fasciculata]|eukprot:XP_004366904.1 methionyl-trna synthetase beta subunit [Cavenderia fasciculata]